MKFCIWCLAVALAFVVGLVIGFFFLAPEVQMKVLDALDHGWVALMGNAVGVSTGLVATGTAVMTWWNGRKASAAVVAAQGAQVAAVESRGDLSTQLDAAAAALSERVDHVATVAIPMAHKAGERSGVVIGIEEGKRQATGNTVPGPLGGIDGPDSHH